MLSEPGSVVISQRHSIKYFGDANPVNSVIYINDSIPFTVKGVFKHLPHNTHFKFDLVMTTAGIDELDSRFVARARGRGNLIGATYIKVDHSDDFEDLQQKLDDHRKELYDHWENSDPHSICSTAERHRLHGLRGYPFVYKSKNALNILRALSFIILFLAWTNYISLSITSLHKRLPEVGTRKVVGARNLDFILQFFVESAIINFFAVLFAITVIQLVKAPVEYLFHFYVADWKTMLDEHFFSPPFNSDCRYHCHRCISFLHHVEKGPADLLKKLRAVQMPWWIKAMVTFQYASAVVLLIWIGTVYFQLNYIFNKNRGIDQEGILVVDRPLTRNGNYLQKLDYFY